MTIFISGIYGVGKSTIGKKLSEMTKKPYYSASELISKRNGEEYKTNKVVKDKIDNQNILINAVNDIKRELGDVLLDGHFCIINKEGKIEELPVFVYKKIGINCIVLIEAEIAEVVSNLKKRDNIKYKLDTLSEMKTKERELAKKIACELGVNLIIHNAIYDGLDAKRIFDKLEFKGE